MSTLYVKIGGMHCHHCEVKLTAGLLCFPQVSAVKFDGDIAVLTYDGELDHQEIVDVVSELSYVTSLEQIADQPQALRQRVKLWELVAIVAVVLLVNFLLRWLLGVNIFALVPRVDSGASDLVLLGTGLLTSIHCVSMCGALNLTAVYQPHLGESRWRRPLLYNCGRVVAYTVLGGLVGWLGSTLQFADTPRGILIIVVAAIMLLTALDLLGWVHFRPHWWSGLRQKFSVSSPLVIGLLNGLMPCGPLQTMQLYALATGSFWLGAKALLLFGLGTVPLMLALGVVANWFDGRRRLLVNKIAAVLILLLSLSMLQRGLLTLGINLSADMLAPTAVDRSRYANYQAATLRDDHQEVAFDLQVSNYADLLVQVGVPVRLTIHVDADQLTGCNQEIVLRDFGVRQQLVPGDNVLEFTPTQTGTFTYTCGMAMISNQILVVDDQEFLTGGK